MGQQFYYRFKLRYVFLALLAMSLMGVARAAGQSEKDVWLIVRDGGRGLEIPEGVIVRFDGAGELSYNEHGRMRLHDGCVVKVNGQVVGERQIARREGSVQIVNESKGTVLELKPGPDARQFPLESDDVIQLAFSHGEIAYSADEPLAAFVWARRGGGLRLKPISTGVELGIKVEPLSESLSSHLRLARKSALLVTDVVTGGAADRGGLKKFDIITSIEGNAAVTEGKLHQALRRKNSGDGLSLSVLRQSVPLELKFTAMAELPDDYWRTPLQAVTKDQPAKTTVTKRKTVNYELGVDGGYYYGAGGPEPELVVVNSHGELRVQGDRGQVRALLNGSVIPSSRLVREGSLLRILGDNSQTLFVIGIQPNQSLIYSAGQDPYSLRGKVGVKVEHIGAALASQLHLDRDQTLVIAEVAEGSSAAQAGLEKLDIVIRIDGESQVTTARLLEIAAGKKAGEQLRLSLLRRGQPTEVIITVEPKAWPDLGALTRGFQAAHQKLESFGKSVQR